MTDRERTFDLETTQRLRARRSADGLVAQYIRELAARQDDCGAPVDSSTEMVAGSAVAVSAIG